MCARDKLPLAATGSMHKFVVFLLYFKVENMTLNIINIFSAVKKLKEENQNQSKRFSKNRST